MNTFERLDRLPMRYHIAIGVLFTLAIGFLNHSTGAEFRLKIFYLLPISYVTWFIGVKTGIVFSVLPLITTLYSNAMSEQNRYESHNELWNMTVYCVFLIIVALLLSRLRITLAQRASLIAKLQNALSAVRELSGILPICANCKKIRDDEGYWHDVEVYIREHTKAEFTHGICAECASKLYPLLFDKIAR